MFDVTGQRFGKLSVLQRAPNPTTSNEAYWRCRCDCGKLTVVSSRRLRTGQTKSCGCFRVEARLTHGQSNGYGRSRCSRAYQSWLHMRQRCLNPNNDRFSSYGGRGITICRRWLASFENFLADMGERPKNKTLDRIDNDGHYAPENCRWSTFREQTANRDPEKARASVAKALKARWRKSG